MELEYIARYHKFGCIQIAEVQSRYLAHPPDSSQATLFGLGNAASKTKPRDSSIRGGRATCLGLAPYVWPRTCWPA